MLNIQFLKKLLGPAVNTINTEFISLERFRRCSSPSGAPPKNRRCVRLFGYGQVATPKLHVG
jgi:hypothetical protein